MAERVLLSYTAPPDPRVVDCYSGIEVIRRQHEKTGQLLTVVGTEHKAIRWNPEYRGIRKEFAFIIDSPRSQQIGVQVYTEPARRIPIWHNGELLPGEKEPAISANNLNQSMRLHRDVGLVSGLAVSNGCELATILTPNEEKSILIQLSQQFSREAIMRYLIMRQIPAWYGMKERKRKQNLGDFLEKDVSLYFKNLLSPEWENFDFSLEHSIGVTAENFNDLAKYMGEDRIQYALRHTVGHLNGMIPLGEKLYDSDAVSEAYHKLKDHISLDKLIKSWGEETTPNVIYFVGKPHERAIAGELDQYGIPVERIWK